VSSGQHRSVFPQFRRQKRHERTLEDGELGSSRLRDLLATLDAAAAEFSQSSVTIIYKIRRIRR
jgi:hypothetical protein